MLPASSPGPLLRRRYAGKRRPAESGQAQAEHRAQDQADEQAAQGGHCVPDPARRRAHRSAALYPSRRRAAHQHQGGQWIPVNTDENADPEAGRNGEREDACRDGDRPPIVGPAGEADESSPAVERHDAERDQDEHPGHAEQHAVTATNDVRGVRIPARSAQLRAGAQHRGTRCRGRRREKSSAIVATRDTSPNTASPVSRTMMAVFARPSTAMTGVPRMR